MHYLLAIKEDPYCSPAEEGIHLLGELHVGKFLVATYVHGADYDGMIRHGFGYFFIGLELFFFGGQGIPIHEKEFSTVETHTFGAITMCAIHILDGTNV